LEKLPEALRGLRPEALAAMQAAERGLGVAFARVGASDVRSKGGLDIVTGTDIAAEDAIKTVLSERSDFPVVGEESGGEAVPGMPCWLVDPICGTRNFASQVPVFAVNVALVDEGRTVCCAVGDGSSGELYVAQRGFGAFAVRGSHARRVRSSGDSHILAVEGWPSEKSQRARFANFVAAAISGGKWEFRSFGTTLSLVYLASGRLSAYVLFSVSPVHTAAGALLVEEAGAVVSDLDGRPWTVASESLVAASGDAVHAQVLDLLAAAARGDGRL